MFDQIRANKRKSAALIAVFVLLLAAVGAAIGVLIGYGLIATIVALVFAGSMAALSYWKADVIALKGDSYRLKNHDLGRIPTPNED